MSKTLEDAIALAVQAHRGVHDKGGSPYILHPLRLMLRMTTDAERMAAVLHDVVEDCADWTLDRLLQEGFPEDVVTALDHLTRRGGEDYATFVARAARNPIARRVKLADLEDNMDVRRLTSVGPHEAERLERYRKAWNTLIATDA